MRIRGTKPEFWRSRRIAAVDWEDRFVLKGLESYVDDNGVGKDDIELIVGDLFQRDLVREPSRTVARVTESISRLREAGLLWRYEVDGTALLYVSFWESAQRVDKPNPGRFRRPDGTMNYKESVIGESFANIREASRGFAPGTEEQGNRGTGEKDPPYPPDDEPAPVAHLPARTNNGADVARGRFSNLPARSLDAYRIAEAFSDSLPAPIERRMLAKVGVAIDDCLQSNIPPAAIAAGLKAWTESDSWAPTQIPMFVHKANNRATTGKPTRKAQGHEQALAELLQEVTTL